MQRKVQAAGLAGAVSVVLVFIVEAVSSVEIPPEVASAITTILSVGTAYLTEER